MHQHRVRTSAIILFVLKHRKCITYSSPLSMLSQKLNMVPEEAERWIVELIRNARLDAKIDSRLVSVDNLTLFMLFRNLAKLNCHCFKGHVVMGTQAVSPYEQVIEKTRALSVRSQMLTMQVAKRLNKNSESVSLRKRKFRFPLSCSMP